MQRLFFIWFLLLVAIPPTKASHLVGGEITYRCVQALPDGSKEFEIVLRIYQDCLEGRISALAADTPAMIGIFDKSGLPGAFSFIDSNLTAETNERIDPEFSNECVDNPPPTCMMRVILKRKYILPPSASGYKILYARCCRNASVLNIVNPSTLGTTFSSDIPPFTASDGCINSSAFFKNDPPQIICIDNPFVYDYSATDADGDSLSYEFCEGYNGGGTSSSKPVPNLNTKIPVVPYSTGYSATKPMAGDPLIVIDPLTGKITGKPNIVGRFVVNVCCHEWRNKQLINTVRREFQFVVTNCSRKVRANMPSISEDENVYQIQCKGSTVKFENTSTGEIFGYLWEFGVPGATSTEFAPTYTYPDTGVYNVSLTINPGTTCSDNITKKVKIYPEYKADFTYSGSTCPGSPVAFADSTFATFGPVLYWWWSFGDGGTSMDEKPTHAFATEKVYPVTLASRSWRGCKDTITKDVVIASFKPFAGNDTVIVKGETINFNAKGGLWYKWSPATNLNVTNISNPAGTFPEPGKYSYSVESVGETGCISSDSINVYVVVDPYAFMPTAFSPNGDGLNDRLRPLLAGYGQLQYFRIFDRWGQMMYSIGRIGENDGWDGTYKGTSCEVGTYWWMLSIKNRFGQDEFYKGNVTLVR
jgi:gliding motility-associated-like protein